MKNTICIIFLFSIAVFLVQFCNQPKKHVELPSRYAKLTRQEQVKWCAGCHKQVWENEKRGPHSNAYFSLKAHKDLVNSSDYKVDHYTKFVNQSFDNCLGCHTPKNMFDSILNTSELELDTIVSRLLACPHPRPTSRYKLQDRNTGIDCMSCHVSGNNVISLKNVDCKEDSIPALQTPARLAKKNISCYLCHSSTFRSFNPEIAIRKTGTARCVNCHQEYNKKGSPTHYYYWQHGETYRQNPIYQQILSDIDIEMNESNEKVLIVWKNTIMPHEIGSGPEMVILCNIFSIDSTIISTGSVRINKKKEFDKEMYEPLGKRNHNGIVGTDIPLNGKSLTYEIPIAHHSTPSFCKIELLHKSQYWFPDTIGKICATRISKIKRQK